MTAGARGYFGIGVERISKPMNLGALLRTAHAFGASFAFTVAAAFPAREVRLSDTSDSAGHLPLYEAATIDELKLPKGCVLVGVELSEAAVDLPSFRHPLSAAYILGPERGSLSAAVEARCAHVVRIPTRFCINVGLAGALVMYDRLISLGRFAPRPLSPGGPAEALPAHVHGGQKFRREEK
jgi:tRNA G18 (ribose-2'-O)-methylase SpoU